MALWSASSSRLRYTPAQTLSVTIARRRAGMADGTHDSTDVMALVVLRFGAVFE